MDNGMAAFLGAFAIIYIGLLVFSLALAVVCIVAQYKLFEKAGEPGWKSIIPFYNVLTLAKIATGDNKLGIGWIVTYAAYFIFYMAATVMNTTSQMYGNSGAVKALLIMLIALVFGLGMAVINGIIYFKLGKSFGKSEGWCIAMIFLAGILIIGMGFDKNLQYVGPNGIPSDQYGAGGYNNNYYNY